MQEFGDLTDGEARHTFALRSGVTPLRRPQPRPEPPPGHLSSMTRIMPPLSLPPLPPCFLHQAACLSASSWSLGLEVILEPRGMGVGLTWMQISALPRRRCDLEHIPELVRASSLLTCRTAGRGRTGLTRGWLCAKACRQTTRLCTRERIHEAPLTSAHPRPRLRNLPIRTGRPSFRVPLSTHLSTQKGSRSQPSACSGHILALAPAAQRLTLRLLGPAEASGLPGLGVCIIETGLG